ncbi:hypothetical protein [Cellulosimicrobium protaetiae]|uniref:IrrE N-terminal-like domain-containing protein n=1 Tax=Cellulosimicrobium protaetiae TaxID=2587808 RepID=A0A6M5UHV4_9MICO|nr:hypothetical protein [Cellulosimicrobium protaetiae]QJW36895.1 hypothetical protein FIC82_012540 [Cellulosimicrobium protaetiae]
MDDLLRAAGLDRARSIEEACRLVAAVRGRPLEVVEGDLGPGVSGLWLAFPERDLVLVDARQTLPGQHRDHVVAHELVHVLEAVGATTAAPVGACRDGHRDPGELRVERLASELMISIASHGSSATRLTSLELYR